MMLSVRCLGFLKEKAETMLCIFFKIEPLSLKVNFYLDAGKGLGLDVEVMDLVCEEGHSRAVLVIRLEGLSQQTKFFYRNYKI
jgi:hypothetical protein